MSNERAKMKLVLSDGQEFEGIGYGPCHSVVGQVIFNTSMVGCQEILSDPSYAGQIVVMTYPLIGQYGIADDDSESRTSGPAGLIVRQVCETPSNFRCTKTLEEYLFETNIPCLSEVDTRMITRSVRDNFPVSGAIVPEDTPAEEALALIRNRPSDNDVTARVSCSTRWFSRTPNHKFDVVVIDCGLKRSIISELNRRGANVTVVPFNASVGDVLSFKPSGVLISSGPGDPFKMEETVGTVRSLLGKVPLCGIGLGHQLIALACGADLLMLGCGHHGAHPVRELGTGRIFTAEQNHCLAVDPSSIAETSLTITHTDVADGAVEGICSGKDRAFSVEFTPEGCPGPQESDFFSQFVKMMEE